MMGSYENSLFQDFDLSITGAKSIIRHNNVWGYLGKLKTKSAITELYQQVFRSEPQQKSA